MKTIPVLDAMAKSAAPAKKPHDGPSSLGHLVHNVINQLTIINLCCYQLHSALPTDKMIDLLKEVEHLEITVFETIAIVEKLALGLQGEHCASAQRSSCDRRPAKNANNVYPFSFNLKRQR